MQRDIFLLGAGAVIGFVSAIVVEAFKYILERKRFSYLDKQAAYRNRSDEVAKFLRGEGPMVSEGKVPEPAWVKVVTGSRISWRTRLISISTDYGDEPTMGLYDESSSHGFLRRWRKFIRKFRRKKLEQQQDEKPQQRQGVKFLLGGSNIIGRGQKCDIQLNFDLSISREHALIRYEMGRFVLYDLGSANNIILNNRSLMKNSGEPLDGGDVIVLGHTILEFGVGNKGASPEQIKQVEESFLRENIPLELEPVASIKETVKTSKLCPIHGTYDFQLLNCPDCAIEAKNVNPVIEFKSSHKDLIDSFLAEIRKSIPVHSTGFFHRSDGSVIATLSVPELIDIDKVKEIAVKHRIEICKIYRYEPHSFRLSEEPYSQV